MENPLLFSTDFRKVTQTILMILSPKQSEGSFFVFAMFILSSRILNFIIFLPPPPILWGKVLCNDWMDCSKISGYGRYGFEVVQKGFEMLGFNAEHFPHPNYI